MRLPCWRPVRSSADPRDLVVDGVERGHAPFVAVVLGRGAGVDALDGDDEAQVGDGGEQPAAPHLGQFDKGLGTDQRGVRRGERARLGEAAVW
jgi:hypothetical protein